MRRQLFIIAALILCCSPSFARKQQKAKFSNAGTAYIENSFGTYDAMQKQIHAFAELGYQEYKSSRKMKRCTKKIRHGNRHDGCNHTHILQHPVQKIASVTSDSPIILQVQKHIEHSRTKAITHLHISTSLKIAAKTVQKNT